MNLIKPSIKFLWMTPEPLKAIEAAGKTCYKTEDKITDDSAEHFVRNLLHMGDLTMIEYASASYRVICDHGVSHEMHCFRHRLFSYAQESTRYCDYKSGVTFIIPPWLQPVLKEIINLTEYATPFDTGDIPMARYWGHRLLDAEKAYLRLLKDGWSPQQARSVLPSALKTEIVITGNLREWLHFFTLRCAITAHPQMQEVANMLLNDILERVPIIFDNVWR